MRRFPLSLTCLCLLIGLAILAPLAPHFDDNLIYPVISPYSDLTITHWPAFAYTRDQLAATGHVPLWRTSILSGTPFAPDPLSGLFYPPHWLAFIPGMPLALAFNLLMWLHLSLAAAAMYVLARRLHVNPWAALTAAVAYAAAPKIIAHLGVGHVTLVEAWAWLPWVVALSLDPSFTSRAQGIGAGAALAMCLLADARLAVYAIAVVLAYLLFVTITGDRRTWWRAAMTWVIMVVVTFALSAAAWLPALTLTDGSARANLTANEAGVFSLDAVYVLGTIIADRSGAAERTTYLGIVVLMLAAAGVKLRWRTQRRLVLWLLSLVVVGVLLALGTHTPLFSLLVKFPGSTLLRVPARAWFVVTFAVAILAGLGVAGLLDWAGRAKSRSVLLLSAIGLFAGLFGLLGALTTQSISLLSLGLLAPASSVLIILRLQQRLTAQRFALLAVLLVAVDLLPVAWALYRPISEVDAFADGQEPARWLARQPDQFRTYSPSYSLPQHVAQQYQLQIADGIDPLQLQRYVKFMQLASGVGEWAYSVTLPAFVGAQTDADIRAALSTVKPDAALLGLLNVKYVAAAFPLDVPELIEQARFAGAYLYENLKAQPRAFVVGQVAVAADMDEALRWLKVNDVSQAAVVEGLPYAFRTPGQPRPADIERWQADDIRVQATGPGWLVLGEVAAPDWIATLDGQPTEIFLTDVTLRGVYVPWGDHTIEFDYRPRRVYAGILISVLSVIACVAALGVGRMKRLA